MLLLLRAAGSQQQQHKLREGLFYWNNLPVLPLAKSYSKLFTRLWCKERGLQ